MEFTLRVIIASPTWSIYRTIMATGVPICLLCGVTLPDSRYRRSILSEAGSDVKGVVEAFVRRVLRESVVEEVLASKYLESSSVVCKNSCFTSVLKLLNLAKSFQDLHKKLESNIQKCINAFVSVHAASVPLSMAVTVSGSPAGRRKRPSSSLSETPSRKRLRKEAPNTPTRLFVDTTVVENKSAVSVRN